MLGKYLPRQMKTLVSSLPKSLRYAATTTSSVRLLCNNTNNNTNQKSQLYTRWTSEMGKMSSVGMVRTFSSGFDDYEEGNQSMSVEEERERNKQLQQEHMCKLTIDGIPQHVEDHDLENEVLKLFQAVNAPIDNRQVEAVFRVGMRGMVICKFFDQQCVGQVLSKGINLRDLTLYGDSRVFVKQSMTREYNTINYLLRVAQREGRIARYRVFSGTNQVKMYEDDEYFTDITHKNDLIELGLDIGEDVY